MAYNRKNARLAQKKLDYETTEPSLDDQRKKRGLENNEDDGHYDKILDEERKNEEESELTEKQLSKNKSHKNEGKENKTIEARFDDERTVFSGDWRDERTWKTNTLPINELAEEAQRARMKAEGQGDGFLPTHYQEYKRENVGLGDENFAELKQVVDQMDKLWMASSFNRLTTSEKKQLKELKAKTNKFFGKLKK
jgi:hypothetical protein